MIAERIIEHNGERLNMAQWGRKLGLSRERVRQRLLKHPVEVALQPRQTTVAYFREHHPGGRKPIAPSGESADRMITVRVTDADYKAIHSAAHKAEKSMNAFCVAAIAEAIKAQETSQ